MVDLPVTDRYVSYTCTGGETTLDVDWQVFQASELAVLRRRTGLSPELLAFGDDYIVANLGNPTGSQVQLAVSAVSGDVIEIAGTEGEAPEILPISLGGTGASTKAAARTALEVMSSSETTEAIAAAVSGVTADLVDVVETAAAALPSVVVQVDDESEIPDPEAANTIYVVVL